jgi:hypothetical protein
MFRLLVVIWPTRLGTLQSCRIRKAGKGARSDEPKTWFPGNSRS